MSCNYKIGRLKNFVYLVRDLVYNTAGYKVYLTSGYIYKLNANLVTFTETESFAGRYRFNTTVNVTLDNTFNDDIIRANKFKIIVEGQNGMQFLVSPEFDVSYTSDLTITNDNVENILTFNTQSNIPTRILWDKVIENVSLNGECGYSELGINKLSIGRNNEYSEIDYLTAQYSRVYNGDSERIQVSFTYPVEDNDWHYELIEFPDNKWDIQVETNQRIINEYQLFPQYTRQTLEEGTDKFTITLTKVNGGDLLNLNLGDGSVIRWVLTGEIVCGGFNKHYQEKQQRIVDGSWVDTGIFRLGQIYEANSEECGYTEKEYRWVVTSNYMCNGTNKHQEQKQQVLTEGVWRDTGVFRAGELIEVDSTDCYGKVEWKLVGGQYICYPVTN